MANTKQLFTVTDFGGGDGGKGGAVHKICVTKRAHTVVKYGGGQGSHGVVTTRGERFGFSHYGCGTFEGVKTFISKLMVIDPCVMLTEADKLRYEHGVTDVFDLMTVDGDALCGTLFHLLASQLKELARKNRPRGTVGTGMGQAVLDAEKYPELAIRMKDLRRTDMRDLLEQIRRQQLKDLSELISASDSFLAVDQPKAQSLINTLNSSATVDWIVQQFHQVLESFRVVDSDYLRKHILAKDGTVVVESSHGILTDRYYGFHPHTSKLRTLPRLMLELLKDCGYDGDIIKLGVTRGYQIRHGAGPMVTEDPSLNYSLLPGSSKGENRWQGKVRVGALDLVAMRYALEVCGGPASFDGLAVTWFDQILKCGQWPICNSYQLPKSGEGFFTPGGEIIVRRGEGPEQLKRQEQLGNLLNQCRPKLEHYSIPQGLDRRQMAGWCKGKLQDMFSVPVRMVSFGPIENDKVLL